MANKVQLPGPVISIGNIELGGTGKTPLVIKVVNYLKEKHPVMVLSRGYKRKFKKPCVTDESLSARECGDEPYMIFKNTQIPVYVNKKRENVLSLNPHKNTVFVLDDGFQYFKIKRDLDVVVLSKKVFEQGGHVVPFGNLREPLSSLKRADLVIVNFRFDNAYEIKEFMGMPAFPAQYTIDGIYDYKKRPQIPPKKAILLSAIAKNREFLKTAEKMGIQVIKHYTFLDHSYFSEPFLENILEKGFPVITTEKDFYRMPEIYRKHILYIKISLKIEREKEFFNIIDRTVSRQS